MNAFWGPENRIMPAEFDTVIHTSTLESGWDWPVAGCRSLPEFVNLGLRAPERRFFWLLRDGEAAAFFGFTFNPHARRFQTGTFVAPWHRGTGANATLKHASIIAFRSMGLPLAAMVREENHRSIAAMRRLSGQEGIPARDELLGTPRRLFDLAAVPVDSASVQPGLAETIAGFESELRAVASHPAFHRALHH